jgi:hypothetical protein
MNTFLKALETRLRSQYDESDKKYTKMYRKLSKGVSIIEDKEIPASEVQAFRQQFPDLEDVKSYMKLPIFHKELSANAKNCIVKQFTNLGTQEESCDDEEYDMEDDNAFEANAQKLLVVARDGIDGIPFDDWPSYYVACEEAVRKLSRTMIHVQGREYSIRKGYEDPEDNPTVKISRHHSVGVVDDSLYIFRDPGNPRKKRRRR